MSILIPELFNPTQLNRFWKKVYFTDSCWIWQATLDRYEYGQFWYGGRLVKAHRWAYECCHGPIPEGMVLDHLCKFRPCVNVDHLEPVTVQENNRRK